MLSFLVLKAGSHLEARCIDKLWLLLVLKNPGILSQGAMANQRLLLFQVMSLLRQGPAPDPHLKQSITLVAPLWIRGEDTVS